MMFDKGMFIKMFAVLHVMAEDNPELLDRIKDKEKEYEDIFVDYGDVVGCMKDAMWKIEHDLAS